MRSNPEIQVYTGGYFQTNGYVVVCGNETVVVIDAPEGFGDWLEARNLKPCALLLTHLHYDHIIDAATIQVRFGCPVYAHSQPNDDLTLRSVLADKIGWAWNVEEFEVDFLLAGKNSVTLDSGQAFEILHVPGHSPDSLCFRWVDAPAFLFGGDVLFKQGIGRSDFPHGNGVLLIEGIRDKILTLPGETCIFPGHGGSTTVGEERIRNPFLT